MIELANTFLEWAGINVLAAQIMAWLTANGSLGLLILVALGVTLTFLAAVVIIHKMNSIPVNIPYARALVPLALVMAMLVFVGLLVMAGFMFWREGATGVSVPVRAPVAAESRVDTSAAPATTYADRNLPR